MKLIWHLSALFVLSFLLEACHSTPKRLPASDQLVTRPLTDDTPPCYLTKELTTTFHFLQDAKNFALGAQQALAIAEKVAVGCDNAAQRFATTALLLKRAGLIQSQVFELALVLAKATDDQTEAFESIFKTAFAKEGLDLDIVESIGIAKDLALSSAATEPKVSDAYADLVAFCLAKEGLADSKPSCAQLSKRIVALAKPERDVVQAFITGMDFLRSEDGPNLTSFEAKKVVLQLVEKNPEAVDNFIQAYNFASLPGGLKQSREMAVGYALKVAMLQLAVK